MEQPAPAGDVIGAALGLLLLLQVCPPADEVPAPPDWPIGGALGARLYCIEFYESNHGLHMYNPTSGAEGYLQWLPSTAAHWGVSVGDRSSEWLAAARIAALGERYFRSQWVPLQRGLC